MYICLYKIVARWHFMFTVIYQFSIQFAKHITLEWWEQSTYGLRQTCWEWTGDDFRSKNFGVRVAIFSKKLIWKFLSMITTPLCMVWYNFFYWKNLRNRLRNIFSEESTVSFATVNSLNRLYTTLATKVIPLCTSFAFFFKTFFA